MATLKIHRLTPTAVIPAIATSGSACFDLRADTPDGTSIDVYGAWNKSHPFIIDSNAMAVEYESLYRGPNLWIKPHERARIPTGLIFDIPEYYSVRLHPRSGTALKKGLTLANCEGVIDSDYVEEVCVVLVNHSTEWVKVEHGERICQAELVKNIETEIEEVAEPPKHKTERVGGFGHTGVK